MRGRNWKGRNVRTEMKTLECPRCHDHIRLDRYTSHIASCPQPVAEGPSPTGLTS